MKDFTDPGDFCRRCRGSGLECERTERDTTLWMTCDLCRGTGQHTVRVGGGRA